jgi:aminopeptidase-like protein
MANNEVSGPVVAAALALRLANLPQRRCTYRVLFLPETIGAIAYLSRNLEAMKRHTIAGFVITCAGDTRGYSLLPSRRGDTLADRVARCVLAHHAPGYREYSFLDRGSDERQYCSPGVDLPVASIMRSKYAEYPEYHTSLDDLSLISAEGLAGTADALMKCLRAIEANDFYQATCFCEPQLGKRGLYPTLSVKGSSDTVRAMKDLIAYCDGRRDMVDVAATIGQPLDVCIPIVEKLEAHGLLKRCGPPSRGCAT